MEYGYYILAPRNVHYFLFFFLLKKKYIPLQGFPVFSPWICKENIFFGLIVLSRELSGKKFINSKSRRITIGYGLAQSRDWYIHI